jgi:hypothetical protein
VPKGKSLFGGRDRVLNGAFLWYHTWFGHVVRVNRGTSFTCCRGIPRVENNKAEIERERLQDQDMGVQRPG